MTLAGHEEAWAEWRAALGSDRMHHGWILSGKRGLGKAHFALAAAAELVAEPGIPQPQPEAHPDIIWLENPPANDEEDQKRLEGKPYQTKRNISVDQVRRMQQRLTTRPTLGRRRAIVIDSADDLEKSAVNALLKSLEEPPSGTFFLLIAHRPGALLPTVRSRCRNLRFAPLSDDVVASVVAAEGGPADPHTRAAAIAAAEGSPGAALAFLGQELGGIHQVMEAIVRNGDADLSQRGRLAEEIGTRPDRERQLATLDLARAVLAGELRHAEGARQAAIIEAHAEVVRLAAQAPTFNFDPGLLVMEVGRLLGQVGGKA